MIEYNVTILYDILQYCYCL